jgi:AcrR family transcriptional regulator
MVREVIMARKTKQDWLNAGLEIFRESGVSGLTIDALTQALGVTKGSFYHHFSGIQDFKMRFLQFYEEAGTLNVIEVTEQLATAEDKLRKLLAIIVSHPLEEEVVMRAWAQQDADVGMVQARVDRKRVAYVAGLCAEITGESAQGQLMAEIFYALLIGGLQMQPPLSADRMTAVFNEILRLYNIPELEV